jgi:hypothetical protein
MFHKRMNLNLRVYVLTKYHAFTSNSSTPDVFRYVLAHQWARMRGRYRDLLRAGRSGNRTSRSEWPSGLRRGSAADRLLGLQVRIQKAKCRITNIKKQALMK